MTTKKSDCRAISVDQAADLLLVEEIFKRINDSSSVELYAPLEKKSKNSEVLARLAQIERAMMKRARAKGVI